MNRPQELPVHELVADDRNGHVFGGGKPKQPGKVVLIVV
jgi:hypothetical protein